MKKNNIFMACMLGLGTLTLTSCGDVMDEIESLVLDRNLSPIGFEAKNVKETSATLTWDATKGATSYIVEIYADDSLTFASTPKSYEATSNSIDISDLVYDTKYSARVKALDANDSSRDSKWSDVFFRTSAQQIFANATLEDVGDKDIVLHWPAGEDADQVIVYDEKNNVAVTYNLTADDKAKGTAKVSGLKPETKYTAFLYYTGKERGSKTFTTIADLSGATIVRSSDNFSSMLEAATEGQVFALYNGTYKISAGEGEEKAGCAIINHSIVIKGIYPTSKPTIQGRFQLEDGASLQMSNVKVDGSNNATNDQFFNYKTATKYGALDIQDCEFKGAADQKGFYYINVAAEIESINIKNSIIDGIGCDGGDMFDCRKGYIKTLNIENNTISNSAKERDFVRYDDAASSFNNPVPVINLVQNTIYNCQNGTSGKRILYVRFNGKNDGQKIKVANNLIVNTQAVYTNQATTSTPEYSNNYYFSCTNASIFAASDAENKLYYNGDTSGSNGVDPKFKDAAKGDFTIGNETVAKKNVGATRWLAN